MYESSFHKYNNCMWANKLGLGDFVQDDEELITELVSILKKVETDMTIFFRLLSSISQPEIATQFAFYDEENIQSKNGIVG